MSRGAALTPTSSLTFSVVRDIDKATPELSVLLTRVFCDDGPIFRALFMAPGEARDAATYERALEWLFASRLKLLADIGGPLVVARDREGRAVAVVGATVPGKKATVPQMVLSGMGSWPCRWGLASFLRGLYVDAALDKPAKDEWEFVMMAVAKEYQGRGVGSQLVRTLMTEIHWRAGKDAKMSLNTQLPINVRFYERLGFTVVRKQVLVQPWLNFTAVDSWTMHREPGPIPGVKT